jgi:putative redox protein
MTITSESENPGQFRQVVRVDAHTLHADVARADGGEDTAPSPHDYFDASLATCKALTAIWFAKKRGIALDRVEARVSRDASHEREGTYGLRVEVVFHGALSPDEKQKLYDAVSKCPIHKLMTTSTVEIEMAPLAT